MVREVKCDGRCCRYLVCEMIFRNCCRMRVEGGCPRNASLLKGKLAAGLCSLSCGWAEAMTYGHGTSRLPGGRDTLMRHIAVRSPPPSFHTGQEVTPEQRGRQLQPGLGPSKQTICPVNCQFGHCSDSPRPPNLGAPPYHQPQRRRHLDLGQTSGHCDDWILSTMLEAR